MVNLLKNKTTREQGEVGLAQAIFWFSKNRYTISVPLVDNQKYDLIVEKDGRISRVQVKTTRYKSRYGVYSVCLSTKGGNRSRNSIVRALDHKKFDLLFVLTGDSDIYLIPADDFKPKHTINLGSQYGQFKQSEGCPSPVNGGGPENR